MIFNLYRSRLSFGVVLRDLTPELQASARSFPIVTLNGPRQSGKSTLCRATFPKLAYANLEDPSVREFAVTDPKRFLTQFSDGAILDEIQHAPQLVSHRQVIVDEDPRPGRWVLTGSQNFTLTHAVSQSLAGRTAMLQLPPLNWAEVSRFERAPADLDTAMLFGGYPRIHDAGMEPARWLQSYVQTYLERDVRSLKSVGDLSTFQKFLQLCAGRTGQLLKLSSLADDCGITQPTAKAWMSVLEASFIVFLLRPWFSNSDKRLVKSPKLHFFDSGLVCWLMGIREPGQLAVHPMRGSIFESWAAAEIYKQRLARGDGSGIYFYRDAKEREADMLLEARPPAGHPWVIEMKSGSTIVNDMLKSGLRIAGQLPDMTTLQTAIVYGGDVSQERSDCKVVPWRKVQMTAW